jgi:hypothetical protein
MNRWRPLRVLSKSKQLSSSKNPAKDMVQPAKFNVFAEWTLRIAPLIVSLGTFGWAYYQFDLGGNDGWMINLDMKTEVLPYKDDLRMLVVHVKSKNPRASTIEFDREAKDTYTLTVRKIPDSGKSGTGLRIDKGALITEVDLMPPDGEYLFLPNAEFDDMATVILPANSIVSLSVLLDRHDSNFVSAAKIVEVKL